MKNTRFASRQKSEKLEFSRMANTRFSDWAADGSSPALSRRRGGPALRVQDARPQQRRESPRRRRYGCALLLFCEELLSLHRVQVESTRGLTVLTDHAGPTAAFTRASRSPSSRSTPGNFFLKKKFHCARVRGAGERLFCNCLTLSSRFLCSMCLFVRSSCPPPPGPKGERSAKGASWREPKGA